MAASQLPCTSQVELSVSCTNLPNLDILSKSDPYCIVFTKNPWEDSYHEFARTETIDDNLSPQWVKKFIFDYHFERVQNLRFEVWDKDPGNDDFIGSHDTTLAEVISYSTGSAYTAPLVFNERSNRGNLVIIAEELSDCKNARNVIELHFSAVNLTKSFFGWVNPKPFLVISRANESASMTVVARNDPERSTSDPVWKPINISVRSLCNGDYDRAIKIEVFNWCRSGSHKLLGSCQTSLREMLHGEKEPFSAGVTQQNLGPNVISKCTEPKRYPLADPAKPKKSPSKKALVLRGISLFKEFSFLDYIQSGTELHFALAIDFTSSNGLPNEPSSLHYIDLSGKNQNPYELALRAVGRIIAPYDKTHLFPAFGFGARIGNGEVSHQFPLNGSSAYPYCPDIETIIGHYRQCLKTVALCGPTNFSPVINNTAQIASNFQDGKHYFILLIITDGLLSDMAQTKRAIVAASKLPLSIIIVGVGNADFGAMEVLDSDDCLLNIDGKTAMRDIVQFVPLNKYLNCKNSIDHQSDLAREVLAEVPEQVTGYMKSKGYWPSKVL